MSSNIVVRYADNSSEEALRADTRAIYRFLVALYEEAGLPGHVAVPNHGRAMQGIYECIQTGAALIAEKDGVVVGSIGLVQHPIWYSDTTCLGERWFYIVPELRDGEVLEAILAEVRDIADDLGAPVFVTIGNIHKQRPPRNRLERIGNALSYQPRGAALRIAPSEAS